MAGIPIPDFGTLATQQGNINQTAANLQTNANRPDQYNQYGSLMWTQGPNGEWLQEQHLDPYQQEVFGTATHGQNALAWEAGQGIDTSGFGAWGDAASYGKGVSALLQGGFGASQAVIDAVKGLQNPSLEKARDAERARLAAMGITLGSDASNTSERNLANAQSDADLKAILAGTQEYGNVFNRDMALHQQGLSEQEKAFTLANALRQQQLSEQTAIQSSNQAGLGALAGTKSNTNPVFAGFTGAAALPPPNQYSAGLDAYNAALAQYNADKAAGVYPKQGYANLAGQVLQAAGGVGGIVGGIKSGYDALSGLWGGGGGSDILGDFISSNGWA